MWKKFSFVVGNNTFLNPPLWYSEAEVRAHQTELSVLIWSLLTFSSRSGARWDLYERACTVRTANQSTSWILPQLQDSCLNIVGNQQQARGGGAKNDWRWSKENSNKRESAGIFPFPAPEWMRNFCRETSLVMFSWLCDYSKSRLTDPCLSEVLHWTNISIFNPQDITDM